MKMKTIHPHLTPSPVLRLWQFGAVCYFCFTLYALFSPHPKLERIGIPNFSLIHTAAFAVLGGLVEIGRVKFSRRITWTLLLLYGPVTEILQPLTGRCFEVSDILEDLLGVLLGIGTAFLLKHCWPLRILYQQPPRQPTLSDTIVKERNG